MRSNALSVTLFVATAILCSCAGLVQSLEEHNDRLEAQQEAQRLADEKQNAGDAGLEDADSAPPTIEHHGPYEGRVKVAVFVTFGGELWQEGMQARAADLLREDLAAHAQFELIPEARMQGLGKLGQPELSSSAWVGKVRDELGQDGPQILLHVTLVSEESIGKNKSSGKIEKYPKFTAMSSYRHVQRKASATYSKDGHLFTNGKVLDDVVKEFHDRALTEIMPAR